LEPLPLFEKRTLAYLQSRAKRFYGPFTGETEQAKAGCTRHTSEDQISVARVIVLLNCASIPLIYRCLSCAAMIMAPLRARLSAPGSVGISIVGGTLFLTKSENFQPETPDCSASCFCSSTSLSVSCGSRRIARRHGDCSHPSVTCGRHHAGSFRFVICFSLLNVFPLRCPSLQNDRDLPCWCESSSIAMRENLASDFKKVEKRTLNYSSVSLPGNIREFRTLSNVR